jgi:hypothetical protein
MCDNFHNFHGNLLDAANLSQADGASRLPRWGMDF